MLSQILLSRESPDGDKGLAAENYEMIKGELMFPAKVCSQSSASVGLLQQD
jgi:hypothetical protein